MRYVVATLAAFEIAAGVTKVMARTNGERNSRPMASTITVAGKNITLSVESTVPAGVYKTATYGGYRMT